MKSKRSQVSIEYIVIIGFVTFVVIGILGVALLYSGSMKDRIKMTQLNSFATKIISNSESIFYAGEPSKVTVEAYVPENIEKIEIIENSLIFTIQTTSGENRIAYSSKVPISGTMESFSGSDRFEITALQDRVLIERV